MIHIFTVHHKTGKFLQLQNAYFKKYTKGEFTLYCGIGGFKEVIDEEKFPDYNKIDLDLLKSTEHPDRLSYMFDTINGSKAIKEGDVIVICDSDVFPVKKDWDEDLLTYLDDHGVVAIERRENIEPFLNDDVATYPHPSFLAVSYKAFYEGDFDWKSDLKYEGEFGAIGTKIKKRCDERNIKRKALLRTNAIDLHPLFFGVYDGMLYHHGAGSRLPYDSIDIWKRSDFYASGIKVDPSNREEFKPVRDVFLRGMDTETGKRLNDDDDDTEYLEALCDRGAVLELCDQIEIIPEFNQLISDAVYDYIIKDEYFIHKFFMKSKTFKIET
jgi:hypothetical protein